MIVENEKKVMDCVYLSHLLSGRRYLRFNEILALANIKKPSLQRVLARLVRRRWIERKIHASYSGTKPENRMFEAVITRTAKKSYKETKDLPFVESDILEEFAEKIDELEKKRGIKIRFELERRKIVRKGRLKGRNRLWKEISSKNNPKKFTFYSLIEYPYLYRIRGGFVSSDYNDKEIPPWNVREKDKLFWKNSAKDIGYLTKEWKEDIYQHPDSVSFSAPI